ncbi:substrate-binding domain-containing protein [Kaistia dalseonensis]|uniref:Xylitol transport system substrate-binding protein n=1 Tax=Kaistia dalseonensis TaxID=410840 RepID=A0ABU0H0S3_9HYPH|nr:substrate-binding domain-containing protein [Kaistia dalseonensis]MCX5493348.1 substrate-binding domain-containing protein [Kaistia dalseonensis]MDQ0435905.1 putative xylitol transport system substrate-binding protein [Kaistia dalseonensis]
MKHRLMMLAATAAILASTTVTWAAQYKIALMPFGLPEYMSTFVNEIQQHPLVKDGTVEITVLDGRFDASVQSNQMDTLITQKVDAIIFSPIDADAAAAPVARAQEAGIPVVGAVTRANSDLLFAYVGTNDVEGGANITEHLVEELGGKGNVVILEGPIGNSPQLLRRQGIDSVLAKNPDIKLLASKTANWSRAEGLAVMENWLSLYGDQINGVIAQNDEMALGAIQALEAKGLTTKQVKVVSIDGIQDAVRAVKTHGLYTLFKSAHHEGQGALDLAVRAAAGDSYQPKADIWQSDMKWNGGTAKQYNVPWIAVTPENADKFLK